jgi:16S rRNA (guanine1207-N2)-methyltransferase
MITAEIKNIPLKFDTDPSLFSPNAIDRGTLAMLSVVDLAPQDTVLDLGCGYGAVGIWAGKITGGMNVVMSDINPLAVEFARKNAGLNQLDVEVVESDGFEKITRNDFTLILSNPPYHADFSVPKKFIEKGFNRLVIGGKMVMVTKRKEWYKNRFISIFGGVKIHEIDGYYVFVGIKKQRDYSGKK